LRMSPDAATERAISFIGSMREDYMHRVTSA
jgi:hypothetical protein